MADERAAFLGSAFYSSCDLPSTFEEDIEDLDRWEFLGSRYDRWLGSAKPAAQAIPRVIHHIWIGGPLPEKYRLFVESWSIRNPGFERRLWDEASILEVLDERIASAFSGSKTFGAKSDIARYAILWRFGGIYVDTDFECLAPFEDLASRTSFFAGITVDETPQLMNSIMGASPGHPLIGNLLEGIRDPVRSINGKSVLYATGPHYLTRIFFESLDRLRDADIVFPTRIFYPYPSKASLRSREGPEELKRRYARKESMAIHYWEVSWQVEEHPILAALKRVAKFILVWDRLKPTLRRLARRRR